MNQNVVREKLLTSFSLNVSLSNCDEEIAYWLKQEARVKLAVQHMLAGNISGEDLLQICADSVPDVDAYLDTVAENLVFDGLVF